LFIRRSRWFSSRSASGSRTQHLSCIQRRSTSMLAPTKSSPPLYSRSKYSWRLGTDPIGRPLEHLSHRFAVVRPVQCLYAFSLAHPVPACFSRHSEVNQRWLAYWRSLFPDIYLTPPTRLPPRLPRSLNDRERGLQHQWSMHPPRRTPQPKSRTPPSPQYTIATSLVLPSSSSRAATRSCLHCFATVRWSRDGWPTEASGCRRPWCCRSLFPRFARGGTVDDAVALPRDYEIFTGAFECSALIFIALRFWLISWMFVDAIISADSETMRGERDGSAVGGNSELEGDVLFNRCLLFFLRLSSIGHPTYCFPRWWMW